MVLTIDGPAKTHNLRTEHYNTEQLTKVPYPTDETCN